ncbi:MAG: hypothetical protein ACFFCZ_29635 [Promethearchaeota archaeon]
MNKWVYLGTLLLLTSLVSTSHIVTVAQLSLPEPTTIHWYVKEGDAISWYATKIRENENVTSTDLFYNDTGESIRVTEGDIITITMLTLGNASEFEGTCRVQIDDQLLSTRIVIVHFLGYPWIMPVYNRDYWVDFVAFFENQTPTKYTLEGNLLTINSSYPVPTTTVYDISTGFAQSLYFHYNIPMSSGVIELKIDLMTGFFPNISFPTLLLTGVIGTGILLVIYLVRFFRRRRADLS